jgi:hypothetical protein
MLFNEKMCKKYTPTHKTQMYELHTKTRKYLITEKNDDVKHLKLNFLHVLGRA